MVDFSKDRRNGFAAPQRFEADVFDCEVIGTVPGDLNGALARVGGNLFYPQRFENDSSANSDGYISTFRFDNGTVHYRGRYVRTPRMMANVEAKRELFGLYRNPFTDEPAVAGVDRTVANTAPLVHHGKLFALKEDGLPYEVDPLTLETIGRYDFNGAYKSETFTAHPKIDPETGEMICYGTEATGLLSDDMFIYVVGADGGVRKEIRIKVPYISMVHDIAVTRNYILIPIYGYISNMEMLKAGKVHWGWDDEIPGYVGVLARDGDGSDIRWFKGPPGHATVHTVNAWEEGDTIHLDAPIFVGAPFPDFPPVDGTPWDISRAKAYFTRQSFDMASTDSGWREQVLFDMPVADLARMDNRFRMRPYRYAFTQFFDATRKLDERVGAGGSAKGTIRNSYGRFDMQTGEVQSLYAGDSHSLQECQFVPRRPDSPEGDGYLLGVANNLAEMRSELIIADAANLAGGELARVILPFRASSQVHCEWLSVDEFPGLAAGRF
ncbi:MAG TPA: carotenoid oxygenase family protein [Sphingomonadaceae bacterium]|nr:carotenoid oxygenase family protein [Sphingomonadaceae bacterium]